jgi:hypothetical protein
MENSISEIIKTAIELDGLLIKKYLIEQQNKSSDSPPIFFGKLRSLIKFIKLEQPIAIKWLFHETSGGWFDEVGLINRGLSTQALGFETNENVYFKHLEELCNQFALVDDIVNRLFEQSTSTSEGSPISNSGQQKKEKPKEENPLENKFNTLDIEEVIKHFKPLTTKKIKNEPWMTDEDFDIFIRRSFCEEENLSKPKIKIGHGKKYAVVTLFYKFYEFCDSENYTENNKKEPYLSLLKGAFETTTFDNVILSNFKVKSKYSWN